MKGIIRNMFTALVMVVLLPVLFVVIKGLSMGFTRINNSKYSWPHCRKEVTKVIGPQ